ncbi:MAG: helix-turn-helix domain-containing protein [Nitrospiraceae bacterium]|nr:helix-turn-helix domain-containing protein [Nitrospiraceae bacterium]
MKLVTPHETVTIPLHDTGSALALLRRVIHQAKPEHYADCVTTLRQLDALLMGRLVQGAAPEPRRVDPIPAERYLSVEEVCAQFKVTPRWLYRHKAAMPHSQPSRKRLIFPEKAVTRWFASRRAA